MVVRAVDSCPGVVDYVGRIEGRFGSEERGKRRVFDQM